MISKVVLLGGPCDRTRLYTKDETQVLFIQENRWQDWTNPIGFVQAPPGRSAEYKRNADDKGNFDFVRIIYTEARVWPT